jgi:hypothetical protein
MFSENAKMLFHELCNKQKKVADVGIELEIEGLNLPSPVPHWNSKPEGSLQNGIEYITKPIKADAVEVYVDNLRKYIQLSGGEIKPSYRCSTHIHVNMLPEATSDMLGFYVIFMMFEPLFLTLCGNQRNGNLFCMSSYDTGDAVILFNTLCRIVHQTRTHGFGFSRGKYSSLNADRLSDLGTLEVRSFPLSVDGFTVSKWVKWLMNMRQMARDETDKTYRGLWKQVRQNGDISALKIFDSDLFSISNAHELLELGTEGAYELTKVLKTWYYDNPEVRKPRKKKSPPSFTVPTPSDMDAVIDSLVDDTEF